MSLNNEFYAPINYEADVPRAWHNLSTKRSYSVHTGLNTIVYSRRMYQGDVFKITTHSLLQTILPMKNPLFDCFELRLEYYYEPLSNLYGYMDNNTKRTVQQNLNTPKHRLQLFGIDSNSTYSGIIGQGVDVDFPYDSTDGAYNYAPDKWLGSDGELGIYPGINKGSLLNHLGLPVGFCGYTSSGVNPTLDWLGNCVNFEEALVYLDIMRSYHINSQVTTTPFCTGLNSLTDDSIDLDDVFSSINVAWLDKFFIDLRYYSNSSGVRFRSSNVEDVSTNINDIYVPTVVADVDGTGLFNIQQLHRWFGSIFRPYGGWFPTQYKPDLWRNILANTVGTNSRKVAVHTQNGQSYISIDEFRVENKLQRWIDALDLSGGRYSQVLRTVFGFGKTKRLDIPELLAVTKHLIDPSNITSMTAGYNETSSVDLGQKGANVDKYNKARTVTVKAHEDGYVMVIASITPLIGYHQNIVPNMLRLSMEDDFNPNLQRLSYQDVPRALYSALPRIVENGVYNDEEDPLAISVGKQVAWLDEMTDVNRVYGDFASDRGFERSWVLARDYTKSWQDKPGSNGNGSVYYSRTNIGPYVNPLEYNDIFTSQNIGRAPWALHLSFDIKAKRPIGKRYRPSLE